MIPSLIYIAIRRKGPPYVKYNMYNNLSCIKHKEWKMENKKGKEKLEREGKSRPLDARLRFVRVYKKIEIQLRERIVKRLKGGETQ